MIQEHDDQVSHLPYRREDVVVEESWRLTTWIHEELGHCIYQIQVPVPNSLRWVNAYAILSQGRGFTIIDPGMRTNEAEQVWQQVYTHLQIQEHGMEQIILTHYHPDHLGLAGWMQEQYTCPVYISPIGWNMAQRMWSEERSMSTEMCELFGMHGMPTESLEQIYVHMESFVAQVAPLPEVTLLHHGEQVSFLDRKWQVLETHGHAPGQLSFWNEELRSLFVGDHVLPRITPNVSFMLHSDPEPLQSFLHGLKQLYELPVTFAFPGHRYPFAHFHARIDYLLDHHEERLTEFNQKLTTPITAYELCTLTFGTPPSLSIHQFRFAMGETLAHMVELKRRGWAKTIERDDITYWINTKDLKS